MEENKQMGMKWEQHKQPKAKMGITKKGMEIESERKSVNIKEIKNKGQ